MEVCVRACACMHVLLLEICVCARVCVYMCVCVSVCVCVCMHTCVYAIDKLNK